MSKCSIVCVAVSCVFWDGLDYLVPDDINSESLFPGIRVCVPFGRRQVVGVVLSLANESLLDQKKLRPLEQILDAKPLVDQAWLDLLSWVSRYYHFPLGSTIISALPRRLRDKNCADQPPVLLEAHPELTPPPYDLSAQQLAAVASLRGQSGFMVWLLQGITGSGKTEVYMQAIIECLQRRQQVLVLVPEIGLTPQTVARFQQRFSVPVVELHSNLAAKKRSMNWLSVTRAQPMVVIGTRSAVFAPFSALGMIVVDEEHDLSFKQQSTVRYNARDVAIKCAQMRGIPVLLGSATPSLESLKRVAQGQYRGLALTERVGGGTLPKITLLDMRNEHKSCGLSSQAIARMHSVLESGQQVMVFLNRRGYAPVLMCHHCGWVVSCRFCETSMVWHKSTKKLQCHRCDSLSPVIKYCQKCRQSELSPVGYGTERLDEYLSDVFGSYPIIRIDRDSTRKKNSMMALLNQIDEASSAVLVGTQMLAKGHHFPRLTLVVMLDVDGGLFSVDFRAQERLAQLICQVSGRSGRVDSCGEVMIQTYHPEHEFFQILLNHGYPAYVAKVLQERENLALPPVSFMALLSSESKRYEDSRSFLSEARRYLLDLRHGGLNVLGPVPAPLAKRRDLFRGQLLIQSHSRVVLQESIRPLVRGLSGHSCARKVRWSIDIDPLDLL